MNPYQVFHSPWGELRKRIDIVLVRPEQSRNIGSAARAIANMGIEGSFRIVGSPSLIDQDCRRLAKHAGPRLDEIRFFDSLAEALSVDAPVEKLSLAATARIGSPNRPHPLWARTGVERALEKLKCEEIRRVQFVFGPESDGLSNAEVDLCDWVVTIPSSDEYRSLNLAQAILIFCYEANMSLLRPQPEAGEVRLGPKLSQREKLIAHALRMAEAVGFILPGDPFKMKPRLEEILAPLPRYVEGVSTIHGLLDQIIRSVQKGGPDIKGRYKQEWETGVRDGNQQDGN